MDFDEITRILEMMREHDLVEFELERDNAKLRLRKQTTAYSAAPPLDPHPGSAGRIPPQARAAASGASLSSGTVPPVAEEDLELAILKSPIVGTFYRSSEPGAGPFAEVGDVVRKGQVLCIIEAMKLMNEINAELDGELVTVYVESGQAVQYGERLFAIKPMATE